MAGSSELKPFSMMIKYWESSTDSKEFFVRGKSEQERGDWLRLINECISNLTMRNNQEQTSQQQTLSASHNSSTSSSAASSMASSMSSSISTSSSVATNQDVAMLRTSENAKSSPSPTRKASEIKKEPPQPKREDSRPKLVKKSPKIDLLDDVDMIMAVAISDFEASEKTELTLREGDILKVLARDKSGYFIRFK